MATRNVPAKGNSSFATTGNQTGASTGEGQETGETPRDYLFKTGVNNILSHSLNLLVQNRPKDPIAFLVEHFGNLLDQKSVIQEAYQRITWTSYTKPAFYANLYEAYLLFKLKKGKHSSKGLKGSTFNDLILLLTSDIPASLLQDFLPIVLCTEKLSVTFCAFHRKVLTIFIFKDFIKLCESLYQDVDIAGRDRADTFLCNYILEHIKRLCLSKSDTVTISNKGSKPGDFLDGDILNGLLKIMKEDEFARSKRVMKQDEFLGLSVSYFIKMIKN